MASLLDYYQAPTGTAAPFQQAETGLAKSQAETAAGTQTSRLMRNFSERSLPQLASEEAASGRFYSTGAQQRAGFATQDVGEAVGDIQSRLASTLADLTRNGVNAQLGVRI